MQLLFQGHMLPANLLSESILLGAMQISATCEGNERPFSTYSCQQNQVIIELEVPGSRGCPSRHCPHSDDDDGNGQEGEGFCYEFVAHGSRCRVFLTEPDPTRRI